MSIHDGHKDMIVVRHLADFLRSEMQKRKLTPYAFAEFMGTSHTTINKFLDFGEQDVGYPSVDFLIKLAKATDTDIRYLILLVIPPDVPTNMEITPDVIDLGQRIAKLPEHYRKIVEIILAAGLAEESANSPASPGKKANKPGEVG